MEQEIPYDKLSLFRDKLALNMEELGALDPYKEAFVAKSEAFADYMHEVFSRITETGLVMERMDDPKRLKKFWALWFEKLFRSSLDYDFNAYLWRIGIRHVEVGLDQKFSNLGFSVVRRFCQKTIESDVPPEKRYVVSSTLDKLIDYCLLVETSAYIAATNRCDIELIRGIADRVRNKITIIGGNIRMLQRKLSPGDPAYDIYEGLITESSMCEHMVKDINVYNDVFQREPNFKDIKLEEIITEVLEKLKPKDKFPGVKLIVNMGTNASVVSADPRDMEQLMYYTLENAFESASGDKPYVKVSLSSECPPEHFVCVEVFNSGTPPARESVEKFFSPFYTTKPEGSGFGVPISSLAARKNFGKFAIEPVEGGTKVVLTLPEKLRAVE